jgi:hypothetical protein
MARFDRNHPLVLPFASNQLPELGGQLQVPVGREALVGRHEPTRWGGWVLTLNMATLSSTSSNRVT